MQSVTRYLCGTCGSEYKTEAAANSCEEKHVDILSFTPMWNGNTILPSEIKINYVPKGNKKKASQTYRKNYY